MHLIIQCDSIATIIAGFLILFYYIVLRKPSAIEGAGKAGRKVF